MSVIPLALSCLLLAAHFLRAGLGCLPLLILLSPFLLLVPGVWPARCLQALMLLGSLEWVRTALVLAADRMQMQMPVGRMLLILALVALFTALSALPLNRFARPQPRAAAGDQSVVP
ncbi:MAG: hypothetical protein HY319_32640 [Armatimonadetes bacterium]|nr:hypothetical protein [Armatimonadota bacterium]